MVPADGLVSPGYIVAVSLTGTEPRYIEHLFRTRSGMAEVDKYSRGIVKNRSSLYRENFKQVTAPCLPSNEQVLIADAIDQTAEIANAGVRILRRQINAISEYRTRLITDVGTGKLDVREAASHLPGQCGCTGSGVRKCQSGVGLTACCDLHTIGEEMS